MVGEWVPVQGYEGLYEINCDGLVRSLGRPHYKNISKISHVKVLKPGVASNGYFMVQLSKNREGVSYCIHRLLGIHFLYFDKDVKDKLIINHKDGNKLNNSLDNLEWVTYSENAKHAYSTGLISTDRKNHLGVTIDITIRKEIREKYGMGFSQVELASLYSLDQSTVSRILNFKRGYRYDK